MTAFYDDPLAYYEESLKSERVRLASLKDRKIKVATDSNIALYRGPTDECIKDTELSIEKFKTRIRRFKIKRSGKS